MPGGRHRVARRATLRGSAALGTVLLVAGTLVVGPVAAGAADPAPTSRGGSTTTRPAPTTTTTTTLPPLAAKPLPGPGGTVAWAPSGRGVLGQPLLYLASTGAAGLAWMPPRLVRAVVVPGTGDPLPSPWGGQVDPAARPDLVAAFNGGFQFGDFTGGVLAFGQAYRTMLDGQASFVVFADGTSTVALWGRDVTSATPGVAFVRQNLQLLVDGGAPTPAASGAAWGASVAGIATMRSAIGVDANGGLVWAGGRLSPFDLASALVAGGAVRGMQLDINPDWVNFNEYVPGPDGVVHGAPVYGASRADRYLTPDRRDFIAVFLRATVVPGDSGRPARAAGHAAPDPQAGRRGRLTPRIAGRLTPRIARRISRAGRISRGAGARAAWGGSSASTAAAPGRSGRGWSA
jgi:hypothetical protein